MDYHFIGVTKALDEAQRADFVYAAARDDLIVVLDLNLGNRSVTNDAEWVLHTLSKYLGASLPALVIYRGSAGAYDGLRHTDGAFRDFYSLNTDKLDIAAGRARNRHQESLNG